jgi:hypothetical protein
MPTSRTRLLALLSAVALILVVAAPASAGSLGRVSWTPTSIGFGKVQVGLSATRTIWVTNGLKVPALITAQQISGASTEFSEIGGTTNDCFHKLLYGELLNPGETCGWRVTFEPQAAGTYSAKFIAVLSPSPDLSYTVTVNLRGTGY